VITPTNYPTGKLWATRRTVVRALTFSVFSHVFFKFIYPNLNFVRKTLIKPEDKVQHAIHLSVCCQFKST